MWLQLYAYSFSLISLTKRRNERAHILLCSILFYSPMCQLQSEFKNGSQELERRSNPIVRIKLSPSKYGTTSANCDLFRYLFIAHLFFSATIHSFYAHRGAPFITSPGLVLLLSLWRGGWLRICARSFSLWHSPRAPKMPKKRKSILTTEKKLSGVGLNLWKLLCSNKIPLLRSPQ